MRFKALVLFFFFCIGSAAHAAPVSKTLVIGSKRFTENYILGEICAQFLESKGYIIKRKFGMGGTMVAFNALKSDEIDIYPDYTGTIAEAVLRTGERDFHKLNEELKTSGVEMLSPLGFDNSYVAVMKRSKAKELGIVSLEDLSHHPSLKGAFSFEFQERTDGWKALQQTYGLKNTVRGIEVPLTYEALKSDHVDFVEAYSTEPLIKKYDFVILEDNKKFFPKYDAVLLVASDASESLKNTLNDLADTLSNDQIMALNEQAVNKTPIPQIAQQFLASQQLIKKEKLTRYESTIQWWKLYERTKTHIFLTLFAVFLASVVAIPVSTIIAPRKKLSRVILGVTGILQTIPSIALLTFMIPFFGIGFTPAIVGLFVYSLLPILRNTHVAMTSIDPRLILAARGIGLYPREILFSVKLPLAFPTILAGVRTATILNIGTATLAAFIGAGGLGEPIVTGLALSDSSLVLQGAIPAALLAILMDGLFSLLDKLFSRNI